MLERKIAAKNVVEDIRSGMSNEKLMEKYQLSRKQLDDAFAQIFRASRCLAKTMTQDILRGMTDSSLMEKYHLSRAGLERSLEKLLELGLINGNRHHGGLASPGSNGSPSEKRRSHRHVLGFLARVLDLENPCNFGHVKDISRMGLGIVGMQAKRGEDKVIAILGDDAGVLSPFEFRAECRWVATEGEFGRVISGFQIRQISEKDLAWLREFIKAAPSGPVCGREWASSGMGEFYAPQFRSIAPQAVAFHELGETG